jgi:AcrR family transcriptional regulator
MLPPGLLTGNIRALMPSSTPRLAARERRRLIEEAATRLFAERGFAATTVDDIVQAAGVTKPILYRHFESKRHLCVALLERYRDELVAAPLAEFDPDAGDWRAQLAAMGDAWLGYVERHPDAARLLFAPIHGNPEVERVQRELHLRQRETQVALLREYAPHVEQVEAEPLGEALRAGLAAVALWWLDHPEHPRAVPLRALLRLPEGVLLALDETEAARRHDAGAANARPPENRPPGG